MNLICSSTRRLGREGDKAWSVGNCPLGPVNFLGIEVERMSERILIQELVPKMLPL